MEPANIKEERLEDFVELNFEKLPGVTEECTKDLLDLCEIKSEENEGIKTLSHFPAFNDDPIKKPESDNSFATFSYPTIVKLEEELNITDVEEDNEEGLELSIRPQKTLKKKRRNADSKPYKYTDYSELSIRPQKTLRKKRRNADSKPYKCTDYSELSFRRQKTLRNKCGNADSEPNCPSSKLSCRNKSTSLQCLTVDMTKLNKCLEDKSPLTGSKSVKENKEMHTTKTPYKCTDCDYFSYLGLSLIPQKTLRNESRNADSEPNCPSSKLSCHDKSACKQCLIVDMTKLNKCLEDKSPSAGSRDIKENKEMHTTKKPYKCTEYSELSFRPQKTLTNKCGNADSEPNCPSLKRSCHDKSNSKQCLIVNMTKLNKCLEHKSPSTGSWDVKENKEMHTTKKPYKCTDYSELTLRNKHENADSEPNCLSSKLSCHDKSTCKKCLTVDMTKLNKCLEDKSPSAGSRDVKENKEMLTTKTPYKCTDYSELTLKNKCGNADSEPNCPSSKLSCHDKSACKQCLIVDMTKLNKCLEDKSPSAGSRGVYENKEMHTTKKPRKCTECSELSLRQQKTLKNKHENADSEPNCPSSESSCHDKSASKQCLTIDMTKLNKCLEDKSPSGGSNKENKEMHATIKKHKCTNSKYSSSEIGHFKMRLKKPKIFKCTECDFSTVRSNYLPVHMRKHSNEKPYTCTYCEYSTDNKSNFTVHLRRHTKEKPFKCTQCNFTTVTSYDLKIHVRSHTGEKPYSCTECEFSSTLLIQLKRHMKSHKGKKIFKCKECEFTSVKSFQLKTHMRCHTGMKLFSCGDCGHASMTLSNLRVHIKRKHTGEKPYKCADCGYSSATLHHLKRHIKKHTGEKPFKCTKCEYSSSQLVHLKEHKMRKHSDENHVKQERVRKNSFISLSEESSGSETN